MSYSILNSFPEEDLDLRVLPSVNTNKRRSEECVEATPPKKTKAEKFDAYVYHYTNYNYINLTCTITRNNLIARFRFNFTDYSVMKTWICVLSRILKLADPRHLHRP